jgi:hypothetical protein
MPGVHAAFMSYVRFDDQHDDGQISQFRDRLGAEVRAQTGAQFAIFQDRDDIAWGQNWQQRIDEALDAVTLLLVIITPSLFHSDACRAEVNRFLRRERELGRQDLILPVYYIEAPELHDPELREADEMARVLATRQFADWRELRFEPINSPLLRKAIARLASQIRDTFRRRLPATRPEMPGSSAQLPEAVEAIAHREDDPGVDLGKNVEGLALAASSPQGTQGYYKSYEKGLIYWSARGGAQVTTGEIGEYHNVRGGSGGRLGFPLSPELDAQQSPFGTDGRFQRFESSFDYGAEACQRLSLDCGGTVYWSKHGAHATWGGIGEYYELNGGTGGPLGFPVSDEIEVGPSHRDAKPKTSGWCQHFEGGSIYWSEKTEAVAVTRAVADYLDRHHGVASRRGFPVGPDLPAAGSPYGTTGRLQRFEGAFDYPKDILDYWSDVEGPGGATIYTSEPHGVYCVGWGNGILYERLAGTSSWLGFPKSDETDARASKDEPWRSIQEFEGGTIFYHQMYGSVPVSGSIMEYLSQHAGLRQLLGFPVKKARSLVSGDDEQVQFFEHGIVTVRNGVIEAWLRWDLAQET